MGKSKIEWTDYTFNPWIGCTKVSDGCKNCYAETWAERYPKWRDTWGPQGVRQRTSEANWKKPLKWDKKAEAEGVRRKVFCASLADVFESREELIAYRGDLFDLIGNTPHLDWLLLTKRPENIPLMTPMEWWENGKWPENVWIGTSVENQEQADKRIPKLLKVPASVRFLSMEPLLGPVNILTPVMKSPDTVAGQLLRDWIHWVIVGGESGTNRRRMDLNWARLIRDGCKLAGIPYFFKQVDKVQEIPEDLWIREFPNE